VKLETVQVEKEVTVAQMLKERYGIDAGKYFVSVNGMVAKQTDVVKPADQISIIPIVKGG